MNLNVYKVGYQKLKDFLFLTDHLIQLGLMRIFLCGTLLYLAISRQFNMDQYGVHSFIPRDQALSIYPDFYRPAIQYFFWPDQWASLVHLIYIMLLVVAFIGLSNRFLLLITWVLAQGFINRNYSMLFGADLIGTLFLFYLCLTHCHDRCTVKSLSVFKRIKFFKTKEFNQESFSFHVSSVFYRIMQIQISVIYAYTGFEKLKGTTWWDGTALWTVFANPQFVNYDFLFLRNLPLLLSIGTFTTVVFEIYFPAMMLSKRSRLLWLALGVVFHLSIGIFLGLIPFSMVMISTYFLFLDRKMIQDFFQKYFKSIKI